MSKLRRHSGFSLVEVLLAVGTLAIGMIFIGGTFLVAIHFSAVSADRTTATVVANEAFSKIRIFGVDMTDPNLAIDRQRPFPDEVKPRFVLRPINPAEFAYPSTRTLGSKQYFWSALCRRDAADPNSALQVTVFVSRKVGAGTMYQGPTGPIDRPVAMPLDVTGTPGSNVLTIIDDPATPTDETRWISSGYTIVENSTGDIYRVIDQPADPTQVTLDRPWDPYGIYPVPDMVWVVPPPISGGKGPCIEVYQGEVRF